MCSSDLKGPHSYTGEDVVELQVHSSYFILKRILESSLSLGCRLADKGEFTKRAFVNGKIDLTKSESVIDLIHANSEKSHAVALSHLEGHLFNKINDARNGLMLILEQIEGSIDFPDEVDAMDRTEITKQLTAIHSEIQTILSVQDFGAYIQSGVRCLMIGRPNVGKSSLLNALLGKERAIVTDIPGTTRDFLEATIELDGVLFELIDTAGQRESTDKIEAIGITKIHELMSSAHVLFWVLDGSETPQAEDKEILKKIPEHTKTYIVLNKSDKEQVFSLEEFDLKSEWPIINVSAQQQDGLKDLKHQMVADFVKGIEGVDLNLICNVRQIQCLKEVDKRIGSLLSTIQTGYEDDILSGDLKQAILKLGEITGDEFTEEVLDGIFSRFCVGK